MEASHPVILNYAQPRKPWRRRLAWFLLILCTVGPLIHWHQTLWKHVQFRYHTAMLWNNCRRMLDASVSPGLLDVERRHLMFDHWLDAIRHEDAIVRLKGIARPPLRKISPASPGAPEVVFAGQMKSDQSGAPTTVVLVWHNDRLHLETWTSGSRWIAPIRVPYWADNGLSVCATHRPQAPVVVDVVPARDDSSRVRIRLRAGGVLHTITGTLGDDLKMRYSGDSYFSKNATVCLGSEALQFREVKLAPPLRLSPPERRSLPAFLPDGSFVWAGPRTWHVHSLPDGTLIEKRPSPSAGIDQQCVTAAFSPLGTYALLHIREWRWVVWDVIANSSVAEGIAPLGPRIFLTETALLSANPRRTLLVRLPSGEPDIRHHLQQRDVLEDMTIAHIAIRMNNALRISNLFNGESAQVEFDLSDGPITLAPDGSAVARAGAQGIEIRRRGARGFVFATREGRTADHPVVWSPDRRWIAFSDRNYIYIASPPRFNVCWQVANPDTLESVKPLRFSPDGRWLTASSATGDAYVWSLSALPAADRPATIPSRGLP